MKRIGNLLLGVLLVSAPCVLSAATYSANGAGATGNSSVINAGGGGDYTSLAAAAADFQSQVGGLAGDYTFYIDSDLTETDTIIFGRPSNGFSLTIKPAPTKTPTITLTKTNDNDGFSGGIIFGVTDNISLNSIQPMSDITIDGSNTNGGTTRDLTITCTTSFTSLNSVGVATASFPRLVVFAGEITNPTVKNTVLNSIAVPAVSIGGSSANSSYALAFTSRRTTTTDHVITNALVDNCHVSVAGSSNSTAIGLNVSGSLTLGTTADGLIVRDSQINSIMQGVWVSSGRNVTIRDNVFNINQTDVGASISSAVRHSGSNGTTGWYFDLIGNVVESLTSATEVANNGIMAFELGGGPASPNVGAYRIFNNVIRGFNMTGASADYLYRGIYTSNTSVDFVAHHNSIDMARLTNVTGATSLRCLGIGIGSGSFNTGRTVSIANNIIRFGQDGTNAAVILKGNANSWSAASSQGNNIVIHSSATGHVGRISGVNTTTFAAWQGLGYDTALSGAQSSDPASAVTPNWLTTGGPSSYLRFPTPPTAGLVKVAATDIATYPALAFDIDGVARPATNALPGAQESIGVLNVEDWKSLNE